MNILSALGNSIQLLIFVFFMPSRWQALITEIDPTLPSHFCLAELTPAQWRLKKLHQFLIRTFLPIPLLILLVCGLILYPAGWLFPSTLNFLLLAIAIGWLLGGLVSVGVGLVTVPTACLIFIFSWNQADLLVVDVLWGNRFGILWGTIGALSVHLIGNITDHSNVRSFVRQSGGFVISLLVGVGLTLLVLIITSTATQVRTLGFLPNNGVGLVIAFIPTLILSWVSSLRGAKVWQTLSFAMILFWIVWSAVGNPGSEYGNAIGGDLLLWVYVVAVSEMYLCLATVAYSLILRLASPWAAAIGAALAGLGTLGLVELSTDFFSLSWNLLIATLLVVAGTTMRWWRPLLFYPLELACTTFLLRIDQDGEFPKRYFLLYSPFFWDELQSFPLYNLDEHLVLSCQRFPQEATALLIKVSNSHQRWAAIAAQIELTARRLESCDSVAAIAASYSAIGTDLASSDADILLATLRKRSEDVATALQQASHFNQRLVLSDVEERLNGLAEELLRSNNSFAKRFSTVVACWRAIIHKTINDLEQQSKTLQEIPNPYIVGVPLNRYQEIFVGRTGIAAKIESLLRSEVHPPLLIYGPRRMGKTSLLYNLRRLLPSRIAPLFVDLQGPVALATDHAGFLFALTREIVKSASLIQSAPLSALTLEKLSSNPFAIFDQWLDELEAAFSIRGVTTILLTLDEFESLDVAIHEKRLGEEAVLGTLRHIIQHRPQIKLLLAGSHTLDEFQRWSSYLINVQAIHLTYLTEAEAQVLIEHPINQFPLTHEPLASAQIHKLTRGHPYLVQLLCSEIIDFKNEQAPSQRFLVSLADVERTLSSVLSRGSQFFADIERNQVDDEGRQLLKWLARQEHCRREDLLKLAEKRGQPQQLQHTLGQLIRREIIEINGEDYRFQVELIRLWFATSEH